MRNLLFITTMLFSTLHTRSQKIFRVVESELFALNSHLNNTEREDKYYRIVLNSDTSIILISYPLQLPASIDRVKAIKELLSYRGDTRLCALRINNYNPARSQIYLGDNKKYSIQVEALFLINQIVLVEPFNYSSYPIIIDRATKKESSIGGSIVDNAFDAYIKWCSRIEKEGLSKVLSKNIMPLDNVGVKWY